MSSARLAKSFTYPVEIESVRSVDLGVIPSFPTKHTIRADRYEPCSSLLGQSGELVRENRIDSQRMNGIFACQELLYDTYRVYHHIRCDAIHRAADTVEVLSIHAADDSVGF